MADAEPSWRRISRRRLLAGAGVTLGAAVLPFPGFAAAEPHDPRPQWIANHEETQLLDANGVPLAFLPRWTRMRVRQGLRGALEVYVPRFDLTGRVAQSAIGPVEEPTDAYLRNELLEPVGPPELSRIGLPARIAGGANLRSLPAVRAETQLRRLPHNAPVRALSSVQGEDGEEWFLVNLLDVETASDAVGLGYVHNSLVRLPRTRSMPVNPDRLDALGKWFQADLQDPAILVAYEGAAPVWSTLTLKGVAAFKTPLGEHEILRRVPNEIMSSETLIPPVPRDAPGGYYLKNVLWTQYFTWDGASIHYNYWSSNWGYAGSHGCLGVGYNEARFAWQWADIGTPVHVFG